MRGVITGMRVEFEFYGTLRDAVGGKTVVRELEDGTTVTKAVRALTDEYEGLESLLLRSNGELRPNVSVSIGGDPAFDRDEDAALSAEETVTLAPGVAGGAGVVGR